MAIVHNLTECNQEEIRNQIEYLSATPVCGIAKLLYEQKCGLKKGFIRSIKTLGNVKTEFGRIGPLLPASRGGEIKFKVSELVPILRTNPNVNDNGLLNSIDKMIELEKHGNIEFNITLFYMNGEYIIKDGNKRTIAFYENRKYLSKDNINYEAYIAYFIG